MTEKLNDQGFSDRDIRDMASYIHGNAGKRAEHYASLLQTNRGLPENGEARETMARMLKPFFDMKEVQASTGIVSHLVPAEPLMVEAWLDEIPQADGESRNFKPGTIKFRP